MTDLLLRIYGIASALPWWLLCLGLAGLAVAFVLLRIKRGPRTLPLLCLGIAFAVLAFALTGRALAAPQFSQALWPLILAPAAVFLLQLLLLFVSPYRSIRLLPLLLSAAEALWGVAVVLRLPLSQSVFTLALLPEQALPSLLPLAASLFATLVVLLAGKLSGRSLSPAPSPEGRAKALCVSLALLALLLGPRLVSLNESSLRKGLSESLSPNEDYILTEEPQTLRLTVDESAVLKVDGLPVVEGCGKVYTCGGELLGKVYTSANGKKTYQIHAYPCEISQSTQVKAEYLKKQAIEQAEACYELSVNTALAVRVHESAQSAPNVLPNVLLWP